MQIYLYFCAVFMKRFLVYILCACAFCAQAATFSGRVLDTEAAPLMYATVYLQDNPEVGTATNADGFFTLDIQSSIINHPSPLTPHPSPILVFSCIGYETQLLPLEQFQEPDRVVTMVEQPILLTTTVVEARKTHQSKRKKMATLLHTIYQRLEEQSPRQPVQYKVVSDVRMDVTTSSWGMEQMIANVVQIPDKDITNPDSIQFVGQFCKRYCDPRVRSHIDSLFRQETDKRRKQLATSIDSGTIVHRKMWEMSQMDKAVLLDLSDELGRWQSTQPDPQHLLLTYTRKRVHFLGVIQITENHHLLVDNDASLQTYACDLYVKLFLPFSIRIKDADLSWVNLLNMDDAELQKFRLKKANMHIRFETHYCLQEGLRLPTDKTMHVTAQLEDNKGQTLPCELWANQQIIQTRTEGVRPFLNYHKSQKVPRQLVPIY